MQFTDAVALGGTRRTRDGYLVADAKVARTGIQQYRGAEVGRPDMDVVRVYRSPEEVFSDAAMASVAWRPLTLDHPTEMVDAANWKALSVGITGDTVSRDGDHIRVPLTVMDSAAITTVAGGKRQLSLGYTCDLEFIDGVTPEGEAYDAVQKNIRVNHLAICSAARAGPACRIGDRKTEHQHQGGPTVANLKTILVDGLTVETTDAGEAAINKLKGLLDASAQSLTLTKVEHDKALATKDAELATKDAKITELEGKVLDAAALDKLVEERAEVIGKARALDAKVVTAGKSLADIKRAVLGDAVKDKSDAYVDAAFDLRTADLKPTDPVRSAVAAGLQTTHDQAPAVTAHAAMVDHLTSAWNPAQKKDAA